MRICFFELFRHICSLILFHFKLVKLLTLNIKIYNLANIGETLVFHSLCISPKFLIFQLNLFRMIKNNDAKIKM